MKFKGFSSFIKSKESKFNGLLPFLVLETRKTVEMGWLDQIWYVLKSWLVQIFNWIFDLIYLICKFALNVVDFMQMICYKIIGISNDGNPMSTADPIFKFLLSEPVLKAIRNLLIAGVVILIIFSIAAIIRSEYNAAAGSDDGHAKSRIFRRVLKSGFAMLLFPVVLLAGVFLTNAILGSVLSALRVNKTSTVGSTVVSVATYTANNYRTYADNGQRIPILVDFEDPTMYQLAGASNYTTEQLNEIYSSFEERGKEIYNRFAYNKFDTFSDTVYYKNNVIYNRSNYSGYEKFVCTPEQYYAMADFIDYALANNLTFYIKSYDDSEIDWRYVNEAVYNKNDETIKITYNNVSGQIGEDKTYTIYYRANEFDFDSPIQAALKTIKQVLSADEYSDYQFKMLERDDNNAQMVSYKTKKVQIKLSDNYKTTPTPLDQFILYQYYRDLEHNTFDGYLISELANGIEDFDAVTIKRYKFDTSLGKYSEYSAVNAVLINGCYYELGNEQVETKDGKVYSYFKINDNVVSSQYYMSNGAVIEKYKATEAGEDVVFVECLNNNNGIYVKLETDDFGRAILYEPLRVSYNETSNQMISFNGENILLYKDVAQDILYYGNWAEKIYNDLQVIYKDININTLINTDQWLSQFSYIYEQTLENEGVNYTTFNTSLIHPLGLILSELFLGEANEANKNLTGANYQYSSAYDNQTIKALFISLLGEEDYLSAYQQYNAFMKIFNATFANILDETAYYENYDILNDENQSIALFTYKAYLASCLLGKDMATFLNTIAKSIINSNNLSYTLFGELEDSFDKINYKSFKDLVIEYLSKQTSFNTLTTKDSISKYAKDNYNIELTETEAEKIALRNNVLKEIYDFYYSNNYANSEEELEFDSFINAFLAENGDYLQPEKRKIIIEVASNYPYYVDYEIDLANKESQQNVDEYRSLARMVYHINNGIKPTDYDEIEDRIKENYNKTVELSDSVETLLAVYDYWLDQIEQYESNQTEYQTNKYDFIDSLENFIYDSYLRSWVYDLLGSSIHYTDDSDSENIKEIDIEYDRAPVDYDNVYRYVDKYDLILSMMDEVLNDLDKFTKENNFDWEVFLWACNIVYDGKVISTLEYDLPDTFYDDFASVYSGVSEDERNPFRALYSANVSDDENKKKTLQDLWKMLLTIEGYYDSGVDDGLYGSNRDYYQGSATVKEALGLVLRYLKVQKYLDALEIYNVKHSITSFSSEVLNNLLTFKINNKKYTASVMLSSGEFTEYILGYDYLVDRGFTPVFVDKNYQGLLSSVNENNTIIYSTWADMKIMLEKFGQACVDLSNKSSLNIISQNIVDERTIKLYGESAQAEENALLAFLKDSLPQSVIDANSSGNGLQDCLDLMEYLGLTKEAVMSSNNIESLSPNFSGFTLSQYKLAIIDLLYDYQEIASESAYNNQRRFLTLTYLLCAEWQNDGMRLVNNEYTLGLIMRLCGLVNRSENELVGLEFTIDLGSHQKDEANGDVFIVCIYVQDPNNKDAKILIPFMMANRTDLDKEDNADYVKLFTDNGLPVPYSSCYSSTEENPNDSVVTAWFPVIARGIVADGLPTAIKIDNGDVVFYRNDVNILNASKLGLSSYFDDASNVVVRAGVISSLTTTFYAMFNQGKSLTQEFIKSYPRLAIDYNLHLAYSNNYTEVGSRLENGECYLDYNFLTLKLVDLFSPLGVNIIVLILGTIFMCKTLFTLVWGLIQRIFNVVILSILSPAVFATIPFTSEKYDKKSKQYVDNPWIFDNWKATIIREVTTVLGFALGINIFFILVPIIRQFNLFTDVSVFTRLFGGSSQVVLNFVNYIMQLIMLVCALSTIKLAPSLFGDIFGTNNIHKQASETLASVKEIDAEARNVLSGRSLIHAKNQAIGLVKNSVPGGAFATDLRMLHARVNARITSSRVKGAMMAAGVPKEEAKFISKQIRHTMVGVQKDAEAIREAHNQKYYNALFPPKEKKGKKK
ncbi:MAG: hypothetical protein K6F08_03375 [bacterium]|nr:hypothetical protein [bacterium]